MYIGSYKVLSNKRLVLLYLLSASQDILRNRIMTLSFQKYAESWRTDCSTCTWVFLWKGPINWIVLFSDCIEKAWSVLYELRHAHYHPLASQQWWWTCLQRLWVILQVTRCKPTFSHAQGRNSNAQTQAEKAGRRRQRGYSVRLFRR